ncbi:hypothetical protein ACVCEA_23500 [Escherichia coli]
MELHDRVHRAYLNIKHYQ